MPSDLLTKPMPRAAPPAEKFTHSEFCRRVQEQKADLIRGEIFMASPATVNHEEFVNYLSTLLRLLVKKQKLGMVVGSRVAMKRDEENAPEPDLMFIHKERLHLLGSTEFFGAADVAIEVISPGSRRLDTVDKKTLYAEFGVAEYWLFDIYKQEAHFWQNENATWKNLPVDENGIFYSIAITGFWLRLDWLFAAEQPDEVEIVQMILAGLPAERS